MKTKVVCVLALLTGALAGQRSLASGPTNAVFLTTNGAIVYGTYSGIQVQEFLTNCGYYIGPIDGIIGPETQAAIDAFRKDHTPLIVGQTVQNALEGR